MNLKTVWNVFLLSLFRVWSLCTAINHQLGLIPMVQMTKVNFWPFWTILPPEITPVTPRWLLNESENCYKCLQLSLPCTWSLCKVLNHRLGLITTGQITKITIFCHFWFLVSEWIWKLLQLFAIIPIMYLKSMYSIKSSIGADHYGSEIYDFFPFLTIIPTEMTLTTPWWWG